MRINPCLLALAPYVLVAQAPATVDYMAVQKTAGPEVDALLKEFKPLEGLQKAESLLPAQIPAFDASTPGAAMKASMSFSGLVRLYLLAGKAAVQAGEWEKVESFCEKAQAVSNANYEGTRKVVTPLMENWKQAMATAQKFIDDNGAAIKEIQAKTGRNDAEEKEYQEFVAKDKAYRESKNPTEKNEAAKYCQAHLARFKELDAKAITPAEQEGLDNYKKAKTTLEQGPKSLKALQEAIDQTKAEADVIPAKIASTKKNLVDEKDEITKGIAATKLKGKAVTETSGPKYEEARAKYFENVLNTKANYDSRPGKGEKMNFLFRLRHNVSGTPLQAKVDEVIGRVATDQDPLPPAATKAKGKKKAK